MLRPGTKVVITGHRKYNGFTGVVRKSSIVNDPLNEIELDEQPGWCVPLLDDEVEEIEEK